MGKGEEEERGDEGGGGENKAKEGYDTFAVKLVVVEHGVVDLLLGSLHRQSESVNG